MALGFFTKVDYNILPRQLLVIFRMVERLKPRGAVTFPAAPTNIPDIARAHQFFFVAFISPVVHACSVKGRRILHGLLLTRHQRTL